MDTHEFVEKFKETQKKQEHNRRMSGNNVPSAVLQNKQHSTNK